MNQMAMRGFTFRVLSQNKKQTFLLNPKDSNMLKHGIMSVSMPMNTKFRVYISDDKRVSNRFYTIKLMLNGIMISTPDFANMYWQGDIYITGAIPGHNFEFTGGIMNLSMMFTVYERNSVRDTSYNTTSVSIRDYDRLNAINYISMTRNDTSVPEFICKHNFSSIIRVRRVSMLPESTSTNVLVNVSKHFDSDESNKICTMYANLKNALGIKATDCIPELSSLDLRTDLTNINERTDETVTDDIASAMSSVLPSVDIRDYVHV